MDSCVWMTKFLWYKCSAYIHRWLPSALKLLSSVSTRISLERSSKRTGYIFIHLINVRIKIIVMDPITDPIVEIYFKIAALALCSFWFRCLFSSFSLSSCCRLACRSATTICRPVTRQIDTREQKNQGKV